MNYLCEDVRLQKPVFWAGIYDSEFVNRIGLFSILGFVT